MVLENPHIYKILKPLESTVKTLNLRQEEYVERLEHILHSTYRYIGIYVE